MSASDIGFNFRETSGFVTDGADETYVTADSYPTTRAGWTFGWESPGIDMRDRDSGVDRRLAGANFTSGGDDFRVDLPATGDYDVRLAAGDTTFAVQPEFTVRDDTTTFITISGSVSADNYLDAANTSRTEAAWPGSNVAVTQTFASTILRLRKVAAGNGVYLTHLRVAEADTGEVVTPSPVSATWSVVAPSISLSLPVSPASATWSPVAPARTLSLATTPSFSTWTAPTPSLTLSRSVDPVSLAWSPVAPGRLLNLSPTPIPGAWSPVTPGLLLARSVSPASATWSVPSPTVTGVVDIPLGAPRSVSIHHVGPGSVQMRHTGPGSASIRHVGAGSTEVNDA
jgi:hypothetical protein